MLEIPEIILLGLSHKTAPLEIRERFVLTDETIPGFIDKAQEYGLEDIVCLSTCNRVSFYLTAKNVEKSIDSLVRLLQVQSRLARNNFDS